MKKKKKINKKGSVVFISSIGGVYQHEIGDSRYGTSKSAIDSKMKYCDKELATKNIRVNSANTGMVNTPLIKYGTITQEQYEVDKQFYPLKRYEEPEDIDSGIIFLLSEASSWVTGHALVIDGGRTI